MSAARQDKKASFYDAVSDFLNNPFECIESADGKDVYITAKSIDSLTELLKNPNLQSPFFRQRYEKDKKQNFWHLLFGWNLIFDTLNQNTKRHDKLPSHIKYFSQENTSHIYIKAELLKKAEQKYHHPSPYSDTELRDVFTQCKEERVAFYYHSTEDFYAAQIQALTEHLLILFANEKALFTTLFTDSDNDGRTPLRYLIFNKILPRDKIFHIILNFIKTLPDEDTNKILIPNSDDATFHFACEHQPVEQIRVMFSLLQKPLSSMMFRQDCYQQTPLFFLIDNKDLTHQDISDFLSLIDVNSFNQLLQMITTNGNTLLLHAISTNQLSFLTAIQANTYPPVLQALLLHENSNGNHAFEIAVKKGNTDTLRLVMQLYSPYKAAFFGIYTCAAAEIPSEQLSPSDLDKRLNESMGIDSVVKNFIHIMKALIYPKDLKNHADTLKEVVNKCVSIAQGNPLPLPHSTFGLFARTKSLLELDAEEKLKPITDEFVQWYFAEVLPFLKDFLKDPEKKNWVTMMLTQYNEKMSPTFAMQKTMMTLPPATTLNPIYDPQLEKEWRRCNDQEQALAQRESLARKKLNDLKVWETSLFLQTNYFNTETFAHPSLFQKQSNKKESDESASLKPPLDLLEQRREDCRKRTVALKEREKAIETRENYLTQWENNLHQYAQNVETESSKSPSVSITLSKSNRL